MTIFFPGWHTSALHALSCNEADVMTSYAARLNLYCLNISFRYRGSTQQNVLFWKQHPGVI